MDTAGPNILLLSKPEMLMTIFYYSSTNAWKMWQSMQNIPRKFKLILIKRIKNYSSSGKLQPCLWTKQTIGKKYFLILISNSYSSGF